MLICVHQGVPCVRNETMVWAGLKLSIPVLVFLVITSVALLRCPVHPGS